MEYLQNQQNKMDEQKKRKAGEADGTDEVKEFEISKKQKIEETNMKTNMETNIKTNKSTNKTLLQIDSLTENSTSNIIGIGKRMTENFLSSRYALTCQVDARIVSHFQRMLIKIHFLIIRSFMELNISVSAHHSLIMKDIKGKEGIASINIFGKLNLPELKQQNNNNEIRKRGRKQRNNKEVNSSYTSNIFNHDEYFNQFLSDNKEQTIKCNYEEKINHKEQSQHEIQKEKDMNKLEELTKQNKQNDNNGQKTIKKSCEEIHKSMNELKELIALKEQKKKLNDKSADDCRKEIYRKENKIKVKETELCKVINSLHKVKKIEEIFELKEQCIQRTNILMQSFNNKTELSNQIFCTKDDNCFYCSSMKLFIKNFHSKKCKNEDCIFPKCTQYKEIKSFKLV